MKTKLIHREKALQAISREHHHGLLPCWKIRTGFLKGVDEERIKRDSDWFYSTHLIHRFQREELHIFHLFWERFMTA
jgi:hypothetical protein